MTQGFERRERSLPAGAPPENFANGLFQTDIQRLGTPERGKVRDSYGIETKQGPLRVLVTTDRQSAYDRMIATVPGKGQVLNLLSAWWFDQTADIIPNHKIAVLHPNVLIARGAVATLPVEVVMRKYMARSATSTSIFSHYANGEREIYGIKFPDGLQANQELPEVVLTPTTKAEGGKHDQELTDMEAREIVDKELGEGIWEQTKNAAAALFERGRTIAVDKGLILVDTKYEFGLDRDGKLMLIDEIHTPDSSRYWLADTYLNKFDRGETPDTFDKEILRRWLAVKGFRGEGIVPVIDEEILNQMARAYSGLYEMITVGTLPRATNNPGEVGRAVMRYLIDNKDQLVQPEIVPPKQLAVILMGSKADNALAQKIEEILAKLGVPSKMRVGSAHKTPEHVLEMTRNYFESGSDVVFIAVAGRSNALGGFIDANSPFPVINCPPPGEPYTIFSSLEMPSGVGAATVLYPEAAALLTAKILARTDDALARRIDDYQEANRQTIYLDDDKLRN